jgi:riboflavin synthase
MFTGLVQLVATVAAVRPEPPGCRLVVRVGSWGESARIGDSIAVSGCCLTVVSAADECLGFEAGPETLARTSLGALRAGDKVNLEAALRAGEPLGGHFVTGHVDGQGTLVQREDDRNWSTLWFSTEPRLTRQMAGKGCVAIDGVSLTLVDVEPERFSVALIPHTLGATTLGELAVGGAVNLETDLLAKYVETCLSGPATLNVQRRT